jgi:hypothetical protein
MQRTEDLTGLLSQPRTIDPALPSDGGAGGITEPESDEAVEDPDRDDDSEETDETEEIEVGDPRDGP